MTLTKKPKLGRNKKKPLIIYALEYETREGGPVGVVNLYLNEGDAITDQQYEREGTIINEYVAKTRPQWKEKHEDMIKHLRSQINSTKALMESKQRAHRIYDRKDIKRWETEITALQSALNLASPSS